MKIFGDEMNNYYYKEAQVGNRGHRLYTYGSLPVIFLITKIHENMELVRKKECLKPRQQSNLTAIDANERVEIIKTMNAF